MVRLEKLRFVFGGFVGENCDFGIASGKGDAPKLPINAFQIKPGGLSGGHEKAAMKAAGGYRVLERCMKAVYGLYEDEGETMNQVSSHLTGNELG